MFVRIIATIGALLAYAFVNMLFAPMATLATGQSAAQQLKPSDQAYINYHLTSGFYNGGFYMITLMFLLMLLWIWWRPLRDTYLSIKNDNAPPALILVIGVGAMLTLMPAPSKAYYDQKNFTEAYTILPNETAIIVPDTGDNASTQAQMDSEAYLKSKQVPAKRVEIPHAKLSGTGSFYDYYVPSHRLFIVDRTTFSHEWVGKGRGSSANVDESIPCQSKEGLDITVGVSVGASVKEENAAKYLYNFGVAPLDPKANRTDPQIIFQSVYYSRKVADVMNDVGRKKIQTLVCNELSSRTFDQDNTDATKIMDDVQKKATEYFNSVGIALNFIGWADTFRFSDSVQKAVDDYYITTKLGPALATLNAIANIKVQEGLGKGLENHGLPMAITPDILNVLSGLAARAPDPVVGQAPTPPRANQLPAH